MHSLNTTLNQFAESIRRGEPVLCSALGVWHVESRLRGFLRSVIGNEEKRSLNNAKIMIQQLGQLEKVPVQFSSDGKQTVDFLAYLNAAMAAEEFLLSTSPEAQKVKTQLKQRILALKYRLEEINGGINLQPIQPDILNELKKVALEWKHKQSIICEKVLTDNDIKKLKVTSQYEEFAELLLTNAPLLHQFLNWTLRDKNSVAPFVEFPAHQEKLVSCALNGRIGRIKAGELLVISKKKFHNRLQKILTLPFEGQPYSILDDQCQITFRGGYKLTIAEVFNIFSNKYARVGNLEFLSEGFVNWNVHQLAWWNEEAKKYQQVDLDDPFWWKQMPTYEVITQSEAQLRYGWHLDGKTWNAAATATRTTPTLDVDKNHAYLEVAIPLTNGSYAIYPFGKFAYEFPTTFFENLSIFCRNVHATIAFPDENVFYSHRQHASHSFSMTASEGRNLMEAIKKDIIKGRQMNMVFQIESENCAKWVHETLEKAIKDTNMPNLYRIPLLHTEPVGLVKGIFNFIKKLPDCLQKPVLTALHLPFGAATGTWIEEEGQKVLKSMTTHHFWKTTEIYLPAFLHKQMEEGLLQTVSEVKSPYGMQPASANLSGFDKMTTTIEKAPIQLLKKMLLQMAPDKQLKPKFYQPPKV